MAQPRQEDRRGEGRAEGAERGSVVIEKGSM